MKSKIPQISPASIFISILRERREQKGIKPSDLAISLGLHPHIIDDWEHGRRTPRISSAFRWAAALDVTLEMRETK
jgi:transcriptional regulator with XRE-family HTH domain